MAGDEALCSMACVALAFGPTGLVAPGGWRRRLAEATLLPLALVLVLTDQAALRRPAVAALLVLVALAAVAAARPRPSGRALVLVGAAFSLAVRSATGAALAGLAPAHLLLALAATGFLAAVLARTLPPPAGLLAAALLGVLPLHRLDAPLLLLLVGMGLVAWRLLRPLPLTVGAEGWYAVGVPVVLLLATVSPWAAGGAAHLAIPPLLAGAALVLLVAAHWLPPGAVGAGVVAALLLLPPQAPVWRNASLRLDTTLPTAPLPPGTGDRYTLTVALVHAAALVQGTPVAEVAVGTRRVPLRAGIEAAEWAHERADVRQAVAHSLPRRVLWRPGEEGLGGAWGVAGQVVLEVPAGETPVVQRSPLLPPATGVVIQAAPAGARVGRAAIPLLVWFVGTAAAVGLLQLLGRSYRGAAAWLPWAILGGGWLGAATPVEGVARFWQGVVAELALAALVAAWLPNGVRWLGRGRSFLAAATLLLPLAVATPHLVGPLGDDTYHFLLLESLTRDGDLDVTNNIDTSRNPNEAIYAPFGRTLLHSPVLAVFLAPGYWVAGRSGAAAQLALLGAALFALAMRRAAQLGVAPSRRALAGGLLLFSYPLATFSSQLWTEVPGALVALAAAVPLLAPPAHRWLALGCTVSATLLKTRLALVAFPPTVAAWLGERQQPKRWLAGAAAVLATAGLGWFLAAQLVGHPLDPLGRRRLADLLPASLEGALLAFFGLGFDAAGGLAFSAPWLFVAGVGLPLLWRRGGKGERALLVGGWCTLLAILPLVEWRGGDSPPARYLVPLWGALALSAALLLAAARPWRGLLATLIPPTLAVWWVGVTHPDWLVNVGDGGFWLGDRLATRFGVDALDLFPSFLRPSPARWWVPGLLLAGALGAVAACRWRPRLGRLAARATVALWLAAATLAILFLHLKTDRCVELEDPQVVREGGVLEPPVGSFSRFLVANGVRLRDQEAVAVPLRLPAGAVVSVEGWLEGTAEQGATLWVRWRDGTPVPVAVAGKGRGTVVLPLEQPRGRGVLTLKLAAPGGGAAVLDRLVVKRQ